MNQAANRHGLEPDRLTHQHINQASRRFLRWRAGEPQRRRVDGEGII